MIVQRTGNIHFGRSTVAESLPPVGDTVTGPLLVLDDDDWLQVQVVSAEHLPAVDELLTEIRGILRADGPDGPFNACSLRYSLGGELRLTPAELQASLPPTTQLAGIAFEPGGPSRAADHTGPAVAAGFAYLSGARSAAYGILRGGIVAELGLIGDVDGVELLLARHDLVLVEWERGTRAP